MSRVRAFGLFWWDFIVGDDWRAAAGVGLAIGVTAALVAAGHLILLRESERLASSN